MLVKMLLEAGGIKYFQSRRCAFYRLWTARTISFVRALVLVRVFIGALTMALLVLPVVVSRLVNPSEQFRSVCAKRLLP